MRIYKDITSANDFRFWGGAVNTTLNLTKKEIETIFKILDEDEQAMSEVRLNNLFWLQRGWIAEILGYTNWDELLANRNFLKGEIE